MMRTMKKITAGLIVLLMMIQMVPALGTTYSSGTIKGSPKGYKDELDIVASKGTAVLLGQTLELDVNEDYVVEWSSDDTSIATIDSKGILTAVKAGTVKITAVAGRQKASVEVTVINPDPIKEEEEKKPAQDKSSGKKEKSGKEATPASAKSVVMVIVINGENDRVTYDGQEHVLDKFIATSNEDSFDAGKVKVSDIQPVKATDCGFYELNLEGCNFTYDDPDVQARFVVNNSWLRITPAVATVSVNAAEKEEGQVDPELTAKVEGVFGNDKIAYTLSRDWGETPGIYAIRAEGEENQGNYRVQYYGNVLTINAAPVVEEPVVEAEPEQPVEEPAEEPAVETEPEQQVEEPAIETEPEQPIEEPVVEAESEQPADEPVVDTEPEQLIEEPTVEVEPEQPAEEPVVETEPEQPAEKPAVETEPEQPIEEPTVEAEPEQPAEEPLVEAEPEEPVEEPEPEEELVVSIKSLWPANEPMYYMAEVTMEATVSGAETGEYTIQWQYSPDLVNWYDIPGANALRYTYAVDGDNYTYAWRAVVERIR